MDNITLLKNTYRNLEDIRNKLRFFSLCQKNGVIPSGLSLKFNLAMGVNDPILINKIETILDEGSSSIMDQLILHCEAKEKEVEEEYILKKEAVNDARSISKMKRSVNTRKAEYLMRMQMKVRNLKQGINLPEIFRRSQGSRRIQARFYRPIKINPAPSPHVRNLRPNRRRRVEGTEQLRRRRVKRKEQKTRRREVARDDDQRMIEEERRKRDPVNESSIVLTPSQVEVTRLAAKFVPMDRRPVDMGDVNGGFERFCNNMRWAWHHDKRRREEGEEEEEEEFVMVPWYRRSNRRAPKGNHQLEAGLERMKNFLNDPENKRRVKDNMTRELRNSMMELRNLPNTRGAQVVFEDKGNRFVVRDLDEQDNQILEKLEDGNKFDELQADPGQHVVKRLQRFCERWEEELNNFHPNIISFISDIEDTNPSKVKGLIKVHKAPRPDGRHPLRLLLASCGTATHPASKFLQMSINHLGQHLPSNVQDTQAILRRCSDINNNHPEGLPDTTINLGCDVTDMFGSIDQEYGVRALEESLRIHPNPEGLPTNLLLELTKICLEENCCEFLDRFFKPNSGTATGPPHACDFCDEAMGPLDEMVVQQLEEKGVVNTGWTRFRDDGWVVLPGGMEDVTVVEDILRSLHPSIKWTLNARGPSAPHLVRSDGVVVDTCKLEHLDLTIHLLEGKLETDVFQKDIPIYISRRSCHPPAVFKSVARSVATRLVMNCSLERFLSPRVEEYTRYLMASDYSRKEVEVAMQEARRQDREELIRRPRRQKSSRRTFVMVTR